MMSKSLNKYSDLITFIIFTIIATLCMLYTSRNGVGNELVGILDLFATFGVLIIGSLLVFLINRQNGKLSKWFDIFIMIPYLLNCIFVIEDTADGSSAAPVFFLGRSFGPCCDGDENRSALSDWYDLSLLARLIIPLVIFITLFILLAHQTKKNYRSRKN